MLDGWVSRLGCPSDSMFETVKAHPTFNYSKACVYSQDLYEFQEEEILAMCPTFVQKVTKMRNSSNIALLTFFGSTLPDRAHIGSINLRVRRCFSPSSVLLTAKDRVRKLPDVVIALH